MDTYTGIASVLVALTPVMLAVIAVFGARFVKEVKKSQADITTMVDGGLTASKQQTLTQMRATRVLLVEKGNGHAQSEIAALDAQITVLEHEIAARKLTKTNLDL